MADTPTPSTPTTLAPVPGQSASSTNDANNASQSTSQNATSATAASTTNDFSIPATGTGKIYTKGNTPTGQGVQLATVLPTTGGAGEQGPKGDKGDPGATGPAGPAGPAGTVDYSLVQQMIDTAIANALNLKVLQFISSDPTQVYGTKTIALPVQLYNQITMVATPVTPTYSLGDNTAGTIDTSGNFTGADVTADKTVTVTATYIDTDQKTYTATWTVTVKALVPASLSLTGPSTVNSGATGTYALTVRYTDNSTKVVTTDSKTTWSLSTSALGTLAVNVLTAATLTAGASNVTGQIKAQYVEKGVTLNTSLNITDVAPTVQLPKPFYGAAAAPATGSAYLSYANWSTFIQALPSQGTAGTRVLANMPITQGSGQYGWYAYPVSYGQATFTDLSNSLQGAWDGAGNPPNISGSTGPITVQVTINGVTTPYYLYRTDNPSIGLKTWAVS